MKLYVLQITRLPSYLLFGLFSILSGNAPLSSMTSTTRKQSKPTGTSAKTMLFARWRHRIHSASSFTYALFNAMVTKISKWSRIQDSCQITPKIETLVVYAMPDIPSKFQKDPSITFWVILFTHRQTDKQKTGKNITSLAEIISLWLHVCLPLSSSILIALCSSVVRDEFKIMSCSPQCKKVSASLHYRIKTDSRETGSQRTWHIWLERHIWIFWWYWWMARTVSHSEAALIGQRIKHYRQSHQSEAACQSHDEHQLLSALWS